MEKTILLAVDGSSRGFEAVSVIGHFLRDQPELNLTLFHSVQQLASVVPGDICTGIEEYCKFPLNDQKRLGNAILEQGRHRLREAGFPEDRIRIKLKTDSIDPAQDIIKIADDEKIHSIALGRRGRGQLETLLLGSVSDKVAHYARNRTVWIVDAPVHESQKVLVAMQGAPDARELSQYAADFIAPQSPMQFTFLHLMPPVPPTFWDDGHILETSEQKDRQSRLEKWRAEWVERVERFMADARDLLKQRGVPEKNVETHILPTKEGTARDLLNEIAEHKYQLVVMGKKSFHERKPFLMGSHASKVLQNVKSVVLCLVDS